MRTTFTVIWPVKLVRTRYGEQNLSLNKEKLLEIYPFIKNANCKLTVLNKLRVNKKSNGKKAKKKRKSRAEQKEIFEELLQTKKVQNRAEIARKFDVSRAWVSKVLNN